MPAPTADALPSPSERGRALLALARAALASAVSGAPVPLPEAPWMGAEGACFVTLRKGGELRGCIGSLEARRPLGADVVANATSAALHDGRFEPLSPDELGDVTVEVSELTPLEPLAELSEAQAAALLRPGVDGVLLEQAWHRGTFLPQVWDQLPEPSEFLRQLKRKAGLPADRPWPAGTRLFRYQVVKHAEESPP